jgi:hypothetical protein
MADDDQKPTDQPFLARWSQRKQAARVAPPAAVPADEVVETPAPDLPPVDELTPQSDFSAFMHPKVDADLRRAALKKLFSDPHFNVMDGLDTYVDDYSKSDPLPPGMLAGLRQAQNILAWATETQEETAARFAPPPSTADVPTESPSMQEISADTALQQTAPATTAVKTGTTVSAPDIVSAGTQPEGSERKS